MKPTVLTIAYSRLVPLDEINARDETKEGLPEMVASIELRGLIQPLAVRPADNGKYEIIDGRRRYRAIAKLIRDKSKGWTRQSDVPVLVRNEDDSQALESSMIANTVRLPMHPVEQYKVLVRLADRGMTASEIGVRFALPARKVAQNLALGRLAPAIRDAWLKEKIDEDVARAFTVEPREDLQVAAFDRLKKTANGLNAQNVRRELEGTRRPAKDVSAAVLAAYDVAGGEKSVDLFEDATYLTDAALLKKIEAEREDKVLERFRADGWKFVMRHTEVPGGKWWSLPQIEVDPDEVFTPQQQARMAELNIFTGSGAEREAVDAELEELARLGATAAFTAKQRARSGVILRFHGDGDYQATFGVLLDGAQVVAAGNDDSEDGDDEHVFDDAGDDWSASDAATTAESDGDGLGISNALLEAGSAPTPTSAAGVARALRQCCRRWLTLTRWS